MDERSTTETSGDTPSPGVSSSAAPAGNAAGDSVACGRVGRAHGVRGEVFVDAWTDFAPERFVPGAVFATERGPLQVDTARNHSGRWVVGFAGVGDRNAAEQLRGTVLSIASADRAALSDPDEFYDTDLIGLTARTTDGAAVGTITDVLHTGPHDTLVIRTPDGAGEHLIPFVAAIVPTVDVAGGVVVVDPPDGLLEL